MNVIRSNYGLNLDGTSPTAREQVFYLIKSKIVQDNSENYD